MCNQDNTDSFGAPSGGAIGGALGRLRPSPRAPARPVGIANLQPSVRGPAAAPTGLASVTPSARGPRNRTPRF